MKWSLLHLLYQTLLSVWDSIQADAKLEHLLDFSLQALISSSLKFNNLNKIIGLAMSTSSIGTNIRINFSNAIILKQIIKLIKLSTKTKNGFLTMRREKRALDTGLGIALHFSQKFQNFQQSSLILFFYKEKESIRMWCIQLV